MARPKKNRKKKKKAASARNAKRAAKKARVQHKSPAKKAAKRPARKRVRGRSDAGELVGYTSKGLGAFAGGQAGDTQAIFGGAGAGAESVAELLEEGQTFEAEAVAGVENARDPDESEVVTREYPEDDVPEEYREKD